MNYKIISCYTKNTGYEEEANQLKKTMANFGLNTNYILPFESRGTWEKNCAYKSKFILKMLNNYNKNVVWLDSDARILKKPVLFGNIREDIGLYYFRKRQLASGTMYWKNNNSNKKLIIKWINLCEKEPKKWDQLVLQDLMSHQHNSSIFNLPDEYSTIDKFMKSTNNTVIYHTQASRRLKKTINGKRRIVKKNN